MNKSTAALLSIASNSLLITFKFIVGILMGSVSIISEAVHSGVDLVASLIAFFAIKKASEDVDDSHPYGHNKYENVSGFAEAILIFFAAVIIIYEAVHKIISGVNVDKVGLGMLVMAFSGTVNLVISLSLLRIAKRTDSIALKSDALHLLSDIYSCVGVLVGLTLIKITGFKILDPIVAIVVALFIMRTAFNLTREAVHDLVDARLPDEDVKLIQDVISSHNEIIAYHKLRTRKSGSRREIDVHIKIDGDIPLSNVHNTCNCIESELKERFQNCYVVIHPEPMAK